MSEKKGVEKMTELDEKTIDAIHKVSNAIKETGFEVNRFEVFDSASGYKRIVLDIVEKEEKK